MSKSLKKVLKKIVSKDLNEKLAVSDAKLGNSIKVFVAVLYYEIMHCRVI